MKETGSGAATKKENTIVKVTPVQWPTYIQGPTGAPFCIKMNVDLIFISFMRRFKTETEKPKLRLSTGRIPVV